MDIRPRYFIESKDGLFFAANSYYNPEDYIISFLRYVPSDDGDRCLNGIKYKKVNSKEAYDYINKYHPDYLFDWNVENKKMMGVPITDIKRVLSPIERLKEIRKNKDDNKYYKKIFLLSEIFHEKCGIPYEDMGITGSSLIGLENPNTSDIDFIVFGLDNHKRAVGFYGEVKNDKNSILERINDDYWLQVYKKRIKDNSLSFDEFKWYENRKNNRGFIKGTLFDILLTLNRSDLDTKVNYHYKQLGHVKILCDVVDTRKSYDTPATYKVDKVKVLEGSVRNIENIISYTHTYTGSIKDNERVIASGECEEVIDLDHDKKYYNIIIGTTRESINEYIKLENNPIKKIEE